MDGPLEADLRVDAEWIVPVEPDRTVLAGHALIVRAGRILDLLPQAMADARYRCAEHVRLPGQVLIPGLINLHTHAAMTLLRGYADDLPLMTWLTEYIWPAERQWVSPEFVRDGTRLACLEMLTAGVTCFNDMYFFPEAAVEAALEAGQRIAAGIIVIDFPSNYAADPDGYLHKGLALRDALRHEPLVSFCMAPHAPYSVGERSLEKVLTYAEQLGLPVHMHVHETADELRQSQAQYGVRPLARLERLGLLGPGLIAVHAVHLTEGEIARLAQHGCHVAHCPSSNLKLASGLAPIARLLAAGVNVGLGTDGAASNNRLDPWAELKLAALLAKGTSGDPQAVPAHTALRMATLNGARALGLDDQIGSLAAGKQADVVAVDLAGAHTQPCFDPVSQLVYCAGSADVTHVWVAGRAVVRAGDCLTLDAGEVLARARHWRMRLRPS
ncbi:MAG: TRZ/ATZ family hydrolase [Burkholderiales bacterium]|nr:TRZ/ATZ family hydrolase [Burkholderiales bacterium]